MSTASPARRRRAAFYPRWPMRWRRRAMHQYGTIGEQAGGGRGGGNGHCSTWRHGKKPLTIDEVLSAHMVSYPFTVRDCCLIIDGGGAVIMTTAERAPLLKNRPYCPRLRPGDYSCRYSSMPGSDRDRAPDIGARGYVTARLGPGDIDIVELYDASMPSHLHVQQDPFSARISACTRKGSGVLRIRRSFRAGGGLRSIPMVVASLMPSRHIRIVPADRGSATATP